MVRITPLVLSGTLLLCAAAGCAHFVESQAISAFTAALEKGDTDKLKDSTSDSFEKKALKSSDAPKVVRLVDPYPDEKFTIVNVKDVTDDKKNIVQKKVEVTTSKTHRKMQYNLVRDTQSGKWVVDDIVIKQSRKDVTAVKRVTEQVELYLVVQDFLTAWHSGKREQVQSVTTASFGSLLGELPPAQLARLTKKVAGEKPKSDEFRPDASIDGNEAIVKLQRAQNILVLSMRQTKKGWKVADVAMDSRKDKDLLPSARKNATVVRTVVKFLKSYKNDDKKTLQEITNSKFYQDLKVAELRLIPLPTTESLGEKDVIKLHPQGAEYVVDFDSKTIKLSLTCSSPDADDAVYRVDDVTIFDSKEEKRLSALFMAQVKMQLFMSALLKGNLTLVRENSTSDLKSKIWKRMGTLSLADILPPEIEMEMPVINGSDFHGSTIRIHVHQGSRELTYVLRDWSGQVTVDDILMPVMDRPSSMKETMQALLPIRLLASALRQASVSTEGQERQLQLVKAVTSNDFNRVVWSQTAQIPETAINSVLHLDAPLSTISDTPNGQVVQLGDDRFGARIELNRERDVLVVDRLWLLKGTQTDPIELKVALKEQLSKHGPRGPVIDPMSADPIATEPPRSAEIPADDLPASLETRGATPSAESASPRIDGAPKRARSSQPVALPAAP